MEEWNYNGGGYGQQRTLSAQPAGTPPLLPPATIRVLTVGAMKTMDTPTRLDDLIAELQLRRADGG